MAAAIDATTVATVAKLKAITDPELFVEAATHLWSTRRKNKFKTSAFVGVLLDFCIEKQCDAVELFAELVAGNHVPRSGFNFYKLPRGMFALIPDIHLMITYRFGGRYPHSTVFTVLQTVDVTDFKWKLRFLLKDKFFKWPKIQRELNYRIVWCIEKEPEKIAGLKMILDYQPEMFENDVLNDLLYQACHRRVLGLVKLLLTHESGLSLDKCDSVLLTAVTTSQYNHPEEVEEARKGPGRLSLELVQYLVDNGANIKITDENGKNVIGQLRENPSSEVRTAIARYLDQYFCTVIPVRLSPRPDHPAFKFRYNPDYGYLNFSTTICDGQAVTVECTVQCLTAPPGTVFVETVTEKMCEMKNVRGETVPYKHIVRKFSMPVDVAPAPAPALVAN